MSEESNNATNEIAERITEIVEMINEVSSTDVAFASHGSAGLQAVESNKVRIVKGAEELLTLLREYHQDVPVSVVNNAITKVRNRIKNLRENGIKEALRIGKLGPESDARNFNFAAEKKQLIESTRDAAESLESETRLERLELRQAEIRNWLKPAHISDLREEIKNAAISASDSASIAELTKRSIQGLLSEKALNEAQTRFGERSIYHMRHEWLWTGLAFVSFASLWFAIQKATDITLSDGVSWTDLPVLLKKSFWILLAGLAVRFCLTRLNLERNLRLLYRHRHTVMTEYPTLEAGLDEVNKQLFRLEISKLIFTDPATGFTESAASNVMNFSPVVSTLDRVSKTVS